MYAIICDARSGKNQGVRLLALVDRKKTRRFWWTSDNAKLILEISDRAEAEAKAADLKQNNARVVSYADAKRQIKSQKRKILEIKEDQARNRDHQNCMDAVELGWDAHKDW